MKCPSSIYSQIPSHSTFCGGSCRFDSSGKEKDSETGLSYFVARYYEPEMLNIWLSVDLMSDKYPNMSPYNYCAWTRPTGGDEHRWIKYNIVNNPIKLVDPDGMEVEYSSFGDWIRVSFLRIVNLDFRFRFNVLNASEEIYVFNEYNGVSMNGGEFTTEGNKLFINYNTWKKDEQGTHGLVNLKHEMEPVMQFECGEVGFDRTNNPENDWGQSVVNFDLMDEVNARAIGYSGWIGNPDPNKNVRNSWVKYGDSDQKKMDHLSKSDSYKDCSPTPLNNTNTSKIKTSTQYMLPYKPRSRNNK